MFLILITSQIMKLKMVRARFVFIKCYQCGGGETLVPVVKQVSTLQTGHPCKHLLESLHSLIYPS